MKRYFFIWIALLLLLLTACGEGEEKPVFDPSAPQADETPASPFQGEAEPLPETEPLSETETSPDPVESRVAALLARMSVEERVGQIFFVRCPESGAAEDIARYHLGGVLLFTRDYQDADGNWLSERDLTEKLRAFQSAAAESGGVPLFIGSDEEGGTVTRASRNPNLFAQKRRSPQQIFAAGGMDAVAQETFDYNSTLLRYGINVNFAPVCDVSTYPGDFIYDRSFGQDAAATAEYVQTVVAQMNQCRVGGALQRMGAVLKHFPGYGSNADTHTGIAIDNRPYELFETADFLPFRAGIDAGAPFVLVSHNVVGCMDVSLPASLSPAVHQILRESLGFDGVVLTDDLAMDAVASYARDGSAAVLAVLAGNDMLLSSDYLTQIPQVCAAVEDGTIPLETLNAACARVLRAKIHLGLIGE